MHTHTGTYLGEGAQLSAQEHKLLAKRAGGMGSTSPAHRVVQKLPARTRMQLRASCATGPAASCLPALWPACCHCPATPAIPRPTPCYALLCRTVCARCTSQSQWLLGPPGRLCALAVRGGQRVHGCVQCMDVHLCAKVALRARACSCFVSVGLALGCYSPPILPRMPSIHHTYTQPHTPLAPPRHSQLTRRSPHTHCTYHTLT
jgi:hypothetical protein